MRYFFKGIQKKSCYPISSVKLYNFVEIGWNLLPFFISKNVSLHPKNKK
jgi:hypothetical protein